MTIDWWTLGIQTVNVVILVWLLGRFFWRPVAAMIEQRRATAQKTLAEAEAKRSQAAAALAEIERTRAGFAREREAILAAAHESRRAGARRASGRGRKGGGGARSGREGGDRQGARKRPTRPGPSGQAVSRSTSRERLAARLDGPAVRAAFLDWLLEGDPGLPDAGAAGRGGRTASTLEAISATPLEPADRSATGKLIGEAFGAHPPIAFKADPALIAGLELRGPHLVVSNSWRADLAQILADIAHDDRP